MCGTCGCGQPDDHVTIRKPGDENHHEHNHEFKHKHNHEHDDGIHKHSHHHKFKHSHSHDDQEHSHEFEHEHIEHEHDHEHSHSHEIKIEQDIMHKNDMLAERNRGYFEAKNIFTLNLVSSPGSGKTSLLERTINELKREMKFYVIEGDQQTMNDANRINATGAPVIQINTGNGCHLDAEMINKAVKKLDVAEKSVLIIENVGNLVCPSLFDLGESKRVVVISVTEGEDKPIKYPNMFMTSNLCIINKTDLLPYVDFNVEKAKEYALRVNHHLEFIELSVKSGEGMSKWYEWLKKNL
ncbi:MAG TPA: hydrogenase nickel incorporation protein HypB [Bacteroidales bacterium]|nr:hydrogenase nickel incorporation protein HypB [Bacteroidales bacterium]HPS17880.1 hydrogenase nickel incorporation protein HypB [Bacteroidales bacterium]